MEKSSETQNVAFSLSVSSIIILFLFCLWFFFKESGKEKIVYEGKTFAMAGLGMIENKDGNVYVPVYREVK